MTKVKLSREDALNIYMFKAQAGVQFLDKWQRNRWMHALAQEMGVTSKTIRDIWNRKSWAYVTSPTLSGSSSINDDLFEWDNFFVDYPEVEERSPGSFLCLDEEPVSAALVLAEVA